MEAVADFCRRHRIRESALFGSILRDDFTDHRDIDVLVDFQPRSRVTFFDLSDITSELEGLFDREVDLVTKRSLHPTMAPDVLASRAVLYAAAQ